MGGGPQNADLLERDGWRFGGKDSLGPETYSI